MCEVSCAELRRDSAVRKRGRGVRSSELCPCCQDLAIMLDGDYSEPLVSAEKKKKKLACRG